MYAIKLKRLHPDAIVPTRATAESVGYDIHALEETVIEPGITKLVRTGFAVAVDCDWPPVYVYDRYSISVFMAVVPRSGISLKTKLRQANSVGVIDPDYRGEVQGLVENTGTTPIKIEKGQRFCQALFIPVLLPVIEVVEELPETGRGVGGFGHTGQT